MLDTSVAIAVLEGEPSATARLSAATQVLLPAATLAELLFGARKSARAAANEARVWRLLERVTFLPDDQAVCDQYADIELEIRRAGMPIPVNDVWVAAACRASGAQLAARDAHFDRVADLLRDEWR